MSGLKPEPISEARSKERSRSLRDNSQKGNGKGEKQIPKGNDRKKSKGNGKSEYRGPSLRSRMTSVVGGNRKRAPRLVGALRVFGGVPGLNCAIGKERHWTRRAYGTRQEVPT
jgi:hypothetical protein